MMKKIQILCTIALVCALPVRGQMKATRTAALTGARNLTLTTVKGTTYYYLVSSNDVQTLHFGESGVRIGQDEFAEGEIQSMRFRSLPRLLMDEDSLTFNKKMVLDHGLVALRRTLGLGCWNSIVLPIDLTGTQLRDAFGEDAQLAGIRGVSEEDETAIEFQTLDLATDDVVLKANNHYMLKPTKEPDVSSTASLANFAQGRVKGPIYLFPNVSLRTNQTPRFQTVESKDGGTQVRFRGTYTTLDGSAKLNQKVEPGVYTLDEETHGFVLNEDSVAVKAFRSWVKDISQESKALRFYVDGVELADGIGEIVQSTKFKVQSGDAVFDLSGRCVSAPKRRGIYIINGKKVVIR